MLKLDKLDISGLPMDAILAIQRGNGVPKTVIIDGKAHPGPNVTLAHLQKIGTQNIEGAVDFSSALKLDKLKVVGGDFKSTAGGLEDFSESLDVGPDM